MRALLRKVMERAGAGHVREAASAEAALEALSEAPAHLLLLDQTMPGMSGAELTTKLRADPAHAGARIILLSGHSSPAFAESARAAGADAVLTKPIAPSALLAAISGVLAA